MKNVSPKGDSDSPVRNPGTRSRVALLIFILSCIILSVGGVTFRVLYQAALEQQRIHLTENAKGWFLHIKEMAKSDMGQPANKNITIESFVATFQKINRANKKFNIFGETGEFTLGTRKGNYLKFLLPHRHDDSFGSKEEHPPILMGSSYAQPMQKALSGESGWMIGNDYRGETVLAAYEAIPEFNLGVVAKMDLAEVKAPFIHAGIIAAMLSVAFILLGILLFRRISEPIIAEIAQEQAWLASILNASKDGILVKESDEIIYVNKALVRMFGYDSSADILGKKASMIMPAGIKPQGANDVNDRIEYALKGRRKDGSSLDLEASVSSVSMSGGENIIAVIRDVTKRKRNEEQMRMLSAAVEQSPTSIIITDTNGNIEFTNPKFTQVTGYEKDDVIGKNPRILKSGKTSSEEYRELWETITAGKIWRGELHNKKKNGDLFWARAYISPIKNAAGKIICFLGIVEDITDRKRIEEQMQMLSAAVEQSLTSIIITNTNGNIEYVNPKFTQVTGYERDEVLGKNPRILDSGETPPDVYRQLRETITAGKEWRGELCNKKKNGELFWGLVLISPIKNPAGKITHFLCIQDDITERKRIKEEKALLEKQLRQSQKMQTLGTLAGGIAHDFNNILQAIHGYADMCLEAAAPDSLLHSDLQQVLKGTQRAKDLVNQILTFSHASDRKSKPLQIHLIVKEALILLRASLPTTIELRQSIADCGYVLADPVEIEQIVMNLCTNAFQAMQQKAGTLQISLEVIETDKQFHQAHPKLSEKKYIRLTVSDTGCGIPPDIQERIFEPFFTTKKIGEGTGLGLSVVHGIVTNSHGDITVSSEPGKGTTFEIYLPQLAGNTGETPAKERLVLQGQGHILFVDDDDAVVSVMGRLVKQFGYEVTVRDNSIDALETFRANPDKFDLLITDQIMPKMTGVQLAEKVHQLKPQLPIILMTGFSDNIGKEASSKAGIVEFLRKPMLAAELSKALHRILQKKQERKMKET